MMGIITDRRLCELRPERLFSGKALDRRADGE
jgi:hypothetical protein